MEGGETNTESEMDSATSPISSPTEHHLHHRVRDPMLFSQQWYWPYTTREEAEGKMAGEPDGSFLIRDSHEPGDFTLTVRKDGGTKCVRIYSMESGYSLRATDADVPFSTLANLVEHYRQQSLSTFNKNLDVMLTHPVHRPATKDCSKYGVFKELYDLSQEQLSLETRLSVLKQNQIQLNHSVKTYEQMLPALQTVRLMYRDSVAQQTELGPLRSVDSVYEEKTSPSSPADSRKMSASTVCRFPIIDEMIDSDEEETEGVDNEEERDLEDDETVSEKTRASAMEPVRRLSEGEKEEELVVMRGLNSDIFRRSLSREDERSVTANTRILMARHEDIAKKIENTRSNLKTDSVKLRELEAELRVLEVILQHMLKRREELTRQMAELGSKREFVRSVLETQVATREFDRSMWLVDGTREQALARLTGLPHGSFLVRRKTDRRHIPFVLSVVVAGDDGGTQIQHCYIVRPNGRGLGFNPSLAVFESLDQLILRHRFVSLKNYISSIDVTLAFPAGCQDLIRRSQIELAVNDVVKPGTTSGEAGLEKAKEKNALYVNDHLEGNVHAVHPDTSTVVEDNTVGVDAKRSSDIGVLKTVESVTKPEKNGSQEDEKRTPKNENEISLKETPKRVSSSTGNSDTSLQEKRARMGQNKGSAPYESIDFSDRMQENKTPEKEVEAQGDVPEWHLYTNVNSPDKDIHAPLFESVVAESAGEKALDSKSVKNVIEKAENLTMPRTDEQDKNPDSDSPSNATVPADSEHKTAESSVLGKLSVEDKVTDNSSKTTAMVDENKDLENSCDAQQEHSPYEKVWCPGKENVKNKHAERRKQDGNTPCKDGGTPQQERNDEKKQETETRTESKDRGMGTPQQTRIDKKKPETETRTESKDRGMGTPQQKDNDKKKPEAEKRTESKDRGSPQQKPKIKKKPDMGKRTESKDRGTPPQKHNYEKPKKPVKVTDKRLESKDGGTPQQKLQKKPETEKGTENVTTASYEHLWLSAASDKTKRSGSGNKPALPPKPSKSDLQLRSGSPSGVYSKVVKKTKISDPSIREKSKSVQDDINAEVSRKKSAGAYLNAKERCRSFDCLASEKDEERETVAYYRPGKLGVDRLLPFELHDADSLSRSADELEKVVKPHRLPREKLLPFEARKLSMRQKYKPLFKQKNVDKPKKNLNQTNRQGREDTGKAEQDREKSRLVESAEQSKSDARETKMVTPAEQSNSDVRETKTVTSVAQKPKTETSHLSVQTEYSNKMESSIIEKTATDKPKTSATVGRLARETEIVTSVAEKRKTETSLLSVQTESSNRMESFVIEKTATDEPKTSATVGRLARGTKMVTSVAQNLTTETSLLSVETESSNKVEKCSKEKTATEEQKTSATVTGNSRLDNSQEQAEPSSERKSDSVNKAEKSEVGTKATEKNIEASESERGMTIDSEPSKTKLRSEISHQQNSDKKSETKLETEISRQQKRVEQSETKLEAEISRQQNRKEPSETKLEAEISRQQKRVEQSETKLEAEISRQQNCKGQSETKLETEISCQQKDEKKAETKLETEISCQQKDEKKAETKLETEISRQQNDERKAETKLEAKIAGEIKSKQQSETERETEISPREKRKVQFETKLETEILSGQIKSTQQSETEHETEIPHQEKRKVQFETKRETEISDQQNRKEKSETKLVTEISRQQNQKEQSETKHETEISRQQNRKEKLETKFESEISCQQKSKEQQSETKRETEISRDKNRKEKLEKKIESEIARQQNDIVYVNELRNMATVRKDRAMSSEHEYVLADLHTYEDIDSPDESQDKDNPSSPGKARRKEAGKAESLPKSSVSSDEENPYEDIDLPKKPKRRRRPRPTMSSIVTEV